MTVYIVASREKDERPRGFLQLWIEAIKGAHEHVEIVFVRNRDVVAFYVLRVDEYPVMIYRDYEKLSKQYHFSWIELTKINYSDELILEQNCRDIVKARNFRFSQYAMMNTALPIKGNVYLMKKVFGFMEGLKIKQSKDNLMDDKYWAPDGISCAGLCATVLNLPNPSDCTGQDVIELCKRLRGGREVKQPLLYSEVRFTDDADIVRSLKIISYSTQDLDEERREEDDELNRRKAHYYIL